MASKSSFIAGFLVFCGLIVTFLSISSMTSTCQMALFEREEIISEKLAAREAAERSEQGDGSYNFKSINRVHQIAKVEKGCRYDSGSLIAMMRQTQRRLNQVWRKMTRSPRDRWEIMPDLFDSAANGFKLLLKPQRFYSGDENKYFLEFTDPQAECHHITVGVGGVWDGEKALLKHYPQCNLLGIDPDYQNRKIVEAAPKSKFLHAALHEKGGNLSAELMDERGYYRGQVVPHRPFYEVLIQNANGHIIDSMTIDTEGAEFSLLKALHYERHLFAKICQFNMEIHYAKQHYKVTLDQFDKLFGDFLEEAHFVLLNVAYRHFDLRQLFFINVGDPECIQKFLC